jgi:beta-lactamase class A
MPRPTRRFTRLKRRVAALSLAALLLPQSALRAQEASRERDAVRAQLEARIARIPGAEVGIAVRDLSSGEALSINGDVVFHAASTMKVPVLIDLMREVDAGRLQLDQSILLVNTYHSIVDGTPYQLQSADDSDSLVFSRIGEMVPLRWLAERMITHSSNLATNALIAVLDPLRITRTMERFGARHTQVLRGVEDSKAYAAGRNNVTSADDLASILVALERQQTASAAMTAVMRDFLTRQVFNDQIPAGLPTGTRVAHKTGFITATLHDAAIIYPSQRPPFVLVVLTRGISDRKVAEQLSADIAAITWQWLVR